MNRPPTGRPVTSNRPSTAARPMTQRVATREWKRTAPTTARTVRVTDRPLTQQGVSVANRKVGPIQTNDQGYWIGEYKNRLTLIATEMNSFESRKINGNSSVLDGRIMQLTEETNQLQNRIREYNILIETDGNIAEDVSSNEDELSKVYAERDALEKKRVELKEKLNFADSAIQELLKDRIDEYKRIQTNIDKNKSVINEMQSKITAPSALVALTPLQTIYLNLQNKLAATSGPSLLNDIKKDSQQLIMLEKKASELQAEMAKISTRIKSINEQNEKNQKNSKYLELLDREKEINVFLAGFGEKMKEYAHEDLSESIKSALLSLKPPSLAEYQNLETEFKDKAKENDNSNSTLMHLEKEREERMADLGRIHQLEEKMELEFKTLETKENEMKRLIVQITDIEGTKGKLRKRKEDAMRLASELENTILIQIDRAPLVSKMDALAKNDTYQQLNILENKVAKLGSRIYGLEMELKLQAKKGDYSDLKQQVLAAL